MDKQEEKKYEDDWMTNHWQHWRSWGSWFSWGSPVGLGLFFISLGLVALLLHYAGLIGK